MAWALISQGWPVGRSSQVWRVEAAGSFFDSKAIRPSTGPSNSECSVGSMPPFAIGHLVKRRHDYHGHHHTWGGAAHIEPSYLISFERTRSKMCAAVSGHKNSPTFINWNSPLFPLRIVNIHPVEQNKNYFIVKKEVFRDGKADIFEKHFAFKIYHSISLLHKFWELYT
jgi:hypothetical protein